MSELRSSAYKPCLVCGEPAVPNPRVLYEITGFERDRSAGGTNHVIARKRTGGMVCSRCAEKVQAGDDLNQGSLL